MDGFRDGASTDAVSAGDCANAECGCLRRRDHTGSLKPPLSSGQTTTGKRGPCSVHFVRNEQDLSPNVGGMFIWYEVNKADYQISRGVIEN